MKRKLTTKADLIVILVLSFSACLILVWQGISRYKASSQNIVAIVEQNGKEIGRYNLSRVKKKSEIKVPGRYHVVLSAEPGSICFVHSDCPDKICISAGRLTKVGQSAVCLPARVSVHLVGGKTKADAFTG